MHCVVCVCVWGVTVFYNRCLSLFCPLICDVAWLETILQKLNNKHLFFVQHSIVPLYSLSL